MSIPKPQRKSRHHEQVSKFFLMIGLHSSGKTTIIDIIEKDRTILPASIKNVDFDEMIARDIMDPVREFGGREGSHMIRNSRRYHAAALIFVIDSNDIATIEQARLELHEMMNEPELKEKRLLILANKQDLPNAMTTKELQEKLALNKLDENIKWHLQASSTVQNKGFQEGFQWLANTFETKTKINFKILATEAFSDLKNIWNRLLS